MNVVFVLAGASHLSSWVKSELLCYRILTVDWDPQGAEPPLNACCCQVFQLAKRLKHRARCWDQIVIWWGTLLLSSAWLGSAQSWEVCMQPPSSAGKLGMGCFCENDKTITSSSLEFLFLLLSWDLENNTTGEGIEKHFYTSLSLNF